jgi:hypothetical protein
MVVLFLLVLTLRIDSSNAAAENSVDVSAMMVVVSGERNINASERTKITPGLVFTVLSIYFYIVSFLAIWEIKIATTTKL